MKEQIFIFFPLSVSLDKKSLNSMQVSFDFFLENTFRQGKWILLSLMLFLTGDAFLYSSSLLEKSLCNILRQWILQHFTQETMYNFSSIYSKENHTETPIQISREIVKAGTTLRMFTQGSDADN